MRNNTSCILFFCILYLLTYSSLKAQDLIDWNKIDRLESKISKIEKDHEEKFEQTIADSIQAAQSALDSLYSMGKEIQTVVPVDVLDESWVLADVLFTIPSNESFKIIGLDNIGTTKETYYYIVKYEDKIGYVKKADYLDDLEPFFERGRLIKNYREQIEDWKSKEIPTSDTLSELKETIEKEKELWVDVFKLNLREQPSQNSEIKEQLYKGRKLLAEEQQGDWIKVFVLSSKNTGWLTSQYVTAEPQSLISEIEIRQREYINNHPDLSQKTKNAILQSEVFIGMTDDQVKASIGEPDKVNRTVYEFGVHEQWVYRDRILSDKYYYFEDGKLTSWQESDY